MGSVFNEEFLRWYLIAQKLNETINTSGRSNAPDLNEVTVVVETPPSQPESHLSRMRKRLEEAREENAKCFKVKQSIYKIPWNMRNPADEKAYIPQIVSLGPYHRGKPGLRDMERHKWRAVFQVLRRSGHDIKLYVNSMKEAEQRARLSYDSPVELTSDEFAEMLVLDGCFMLEIFIGSYKESKGFNDLGYSRNDPIFSSSPVISTIRRDMIMLENQIPLFVLDALLALQPGELHYCGVANMALSFLDPRSIRLAFDPLCQDRNGFHCLDLLKRAIVGKDCTVTKMNENLPSDSESQHLIHSATYLKNAGVKFKRRETQKLWDITFKDGVLQIPHLLVHDDAMSLFFNLVAFEQSHVVGPKKITSYMIFMNNLIDSPSDVRCLRNDNILQHWLGHDAEVANVFNRPYQEVLFDHNDANLCQLSENLNKYYKYKWNAWCATLRIGYFKNPWTIISFIAAVFLILLTVAQTFYTVYAYYEPSS